LLTLLIVASTVSVNRHRRALVRVYSTLLMSKSGCTPANRVIVCTLMLERDTGTYRCGTEQLPVFPDSGSTVATPDRADLELHMIYCVAHG
jgi:hypothetical protein